MDEKSNDNESLIARIQQLEHGMWFFLLINAVIPLSTASGSLGLYTTLLFLIDQRLDNGFCVWVS